MTTSEIWATFSPQFGDLLSSSVPVGSPSAPNQSLSGWKDLLSQTLDAWPHSVESCDDELEPPSSKAIQAALRFAEKLQSLDFPPPQRIIPGANREVVFEYDGGRSFASFRICPDGTIDAARFEENNLQWRRQFKA